MVDMAGRKKRKYGKSDQVEHGMLDQAEPRAQTRGHKKYKYEWRTLLGGYYVKQLMEWFYR